MRMRLNVPFEAKALVFAACAVLMSDPAPGTPPDLANFAYVIRCATAGAVFLCALGRLTVED